MDPVRIAFLKRSPAGKVLLDGFEVADSFPNLDVLPRIGEMVLLPQQLISVIRENYPDCGLARRYEVVGIDHHWDRISVPAITVYIAMIANWPAKDPQ